MCSSARRRGRAPYSGLKPLSIRNSFASSVSLAPQFGFYEYGGAAGRSHRTTPGEFGARASKLYELLMKGHYDVRLPPEAMHRLTVWLDSCSLFYGVYEEPGQQAQLRGEIVKPTLE